jgi:hypothetical protein
MQEVAERTNINHICTQLDKDFDYQVEHWKERYLFGNELSEQDDDDDFEIQSGEYIPSDVSENGSVLEGELIDLSEYNEAMANLAEQVHMLQDVLDIEIPARQPIQRQNAFDESDLQALEAEVMLEVILSSYPTHAAAA